MNFPARATVAQYCGRVRFGVLGPLTVWREDGVPVTPQGADLRSLLAVLLANEGVAVPVERLIADLWPDSLPAHPTNALQVRVSRLRRLLGSSTIELTGAGYRLDTPADTIDAIRFQQLLSEARNVHDPLPRRHLLSEGLALWRGDALMEFADEAFAQPTAERLGQLRLLAVEELVETRLDLGEHSGLVAELAGWIHRYPHRERLRAAHVRALYRDGRQGDALASYAAFRRALAEEHGLDPSPELIALQHAILTRDPTLDTPPSRLRTNLPAQVTALIGRDRMITDVAEVVRNARLVTLTGPGGVGKTRLGFAVADLLADAFSDGMWLVELAGTRSGDEIAEAVMRVFGLRENTMLGGLPPAAPTAHVERLSAFLRDRSVLLLLDNCEHATEPVAGLVRTLLAAAPGLKVLATSRAPLDIPGEILQAVPSLDLPEVGAEADKVRQSSAVRLFSTRAVEARSTFTVDSSNAGEVADLVRSLDGLPLALELAAAKMRALGLPELVARLDDRFHLLSGGNHGAPARQRTLPALLDWSWELLTEPERIVLRRLAVLDGGSLEAVEEICSDETIDRRDVAAILARLVDRSMVVVSESCRYGLLMTVAAYARTRLAEAKETDTFRGKHARYYVDLAEELAPGLFGPRQRSSLERLDVEVGNFHSALATTADDSASDIALRLLDALTWYLLLRGRVQQAARWARRALAAPGAASQMLYARAKCWQTGLAILLDSEPDRASHTRTALAQFDDAGDLTGLSMAQWFLGYVLLHAGDVDVSEDLTEKSSAGFRSLGDAWGMAVCASLRAHHAILRGDRTSAAVAAEEALAGFRGLGDRGGELLTIYPRAVLAEYGGDHVAAERLHRDGLALADQLGMWAEAADRHSGLGKLALTRQDYDVARKHFEAARKLAADHSFKPAEAIAMTGLGQICLRTGDLAAAEKLLREVEVWFGRGGHAQQHSIVLAELNLIARLRDERQGLAPRPDNPDTSVGVVHERLYGG
ncbi:BTAD domain-containing putative transcriptional regulator [Amycolatopsis sp. cmx-11-51]|uniref:BTAD domain-containing putative transcriptional regulator n=1 Tax=Amycolatopsis sp. cmx-11-51 TaxID=2785797 RepID=UPI0039E507F2